MKQTELAALLPKNVYTEFPKWRYSPGQEPVSVSSAAEQDALEGEWFDLPDFTNVTVDLADAYNTGHTSGYVPIEYPKWKYAIGKDAVMVNDAAEEDALEGEWFDNPDCKVIVPEITKAEFDAEKKAEKDAAKAAKKQAETVAKEDEQDGDNVDPPAKKPAKAKADTDDLL